MHDERLTVNTKSDSEIDDKLEVEIGKSIWKVDGPIGRFRFFVIQMGVLFVGLVVIFTKNILIPSIPYCPVDALKLLVIVVAIMLWVSYVAIAKRFYDLTGSAIKGIIFSVIVFLASCILKIVVTIAVIALMLIPGKMIKSDY